MNVIDFVQGDATKAAVGWTVAVVSEGYTEDELRGGKFDADVRKVVDALKSTPPFSQPDMLSLINVVAVRKASRNTGNKIKLLNPAPSTSPFGTAFGAMFGRDTFNGQQITRVLYGENGAVKAFVRGQPGLATVKHFLVIVNNTELDGGAMQDEVGWGSKLDRNWPQVLIHELAHQAFGLADEYPFTNTPGDPASPFTGTEPNAPNVTTETDIAKMKWGALVTLPRSQVPTTVRTTPCERVHSVISANPPIPDTAVGAYEGAAYKDCGIYRPSLNCKMRDRAQPFCRVCEAAIRRDIGHYLIVPGGGTTTGAGSWTHMQSFAMGRTSRMLAYNAANGRYAISDSFDFLLTARRPDGTPPLLHTNPSLGTGVIGPDWTWLVPFTLNGALNFVAHQFSSGRLGMFEMNAAGDTLTATHDTPPGHASHTHVVTLTLQGVPHYIGYNTFTGDAALFRINSNAADPTFLMTMQWGAGHTAVLTVPVDGEPHVMTYRLTSGEVMIRRILPSGFTMTFASPSNFWSKNVTHLSLVDIGARRYVLRYSGLDGSASIYHGRTGGRGVDFVSGLKSPLGLGGLSMFGVGAPATGKSIMPGVFGAPSNFLFFYSAMHGTLRFDPLSI